MERTWHKMKDLTEATAVEAAAEEATDIMEVNRIMVVGEEEEVTETIATVEVVVDTKTTMGELISMLKTEVMFSSQSLFRRGGQHGGHRDGGRGGYRGQNRHQPYQQHQRHHRGGGGGGGYYNNSGYGGRN